MTTPTPEHQEKAREIADKHGAAIVAAMLQADQETHLVNALKMLRNELAALIAKADERDALLTQRDLACRLLTGEIEMNDQEMQAAGLGAGTNVEQRHRCHQLKSERDSFREKAEALDWLEENCRIDDWIISKGLDDKWFVTEPYVKVHSQGQETLLSAINAAKKGQSKEMTKEPEYNCPPVCPKCQRCHRGACVSNEDKQTADSFFAEQFKPSPTGRT